MITMRVKSKIVAFFLLGLPPLCSYGGPVILNGIAGAGNYDIKVTSFAERRFKTVFRQQFDFSCGSAALASLLTFHYEDRVDEKTVFIDMYKNGDQKKIQKEGFSLLDMKQYLERHGYRSDGFKINLDLLRKADVPAITIVNNKGYMHFVIIKGIDDHEVLVGDPALGVRVIPRDQFVEMWGKRILFLIHDKQELAATHFNDDAEWLLRVKAPLGMAVDNSYLASFNMLLPNRQDF